jgi:DNA/RNA endonuclease G (NUC1)
LRPLGERTLNGQLAQAKGIRKDVGVDNTSSSRMRGDYAVPTLFDGNFDAIQQKNDDQFIPGWNGLKQSSLVDINNISGLEDYRTKLNITQPNYAIKLDPGNSITHDNFMLPEWGALRFNVFAPTPAEDNDFESVIKVWLIDSENENNKYELKTRAIADKTLPFDSINSPYPEDRVNENLPAVDLRRVNNNIGDPLTMQSQLNRLAYGFAKNSTDDKRDYGEAGFETFVVNLEDKADIPVTMRGKSVKLRFEVAGSKTAYLDDIYFQSSHLYLGNPTSAKYSPANPDTKNFLLEMPGYAISYNSENKTLNWASYQLNKTWVGALGLNNARPDFEQNYQLPALLSQAEHRDYAYRDPNNSADKGYTRGHMVAAQDRTRNRKEGYVTYLTSNILPQWKVDTIPEPWNELEKYISNLIENGKELYIIDGGYGEKADLPRTQNLENKGINVPDRLWKVIVVLNPGENIADIKESTRVIAVDIPNDAGLEGKLWQNYSVSISTLEGRLNTPTGLTYNFFGNIREDIRDFIRNKGVIIPLLALGDDLTVLPSITSFGTFNETSGSSSTPVQSIVGIRPTPTLGISEVGIDHDGIFQIIDRPDGLEESRSSQINSLHISSSKISTFTFGSIDGGIPQISISEISSIQNRVEKTSSEQSSSGQIGETHVNHFQVSATEINSSQVGITQIGLKLPILSTSSQINPTKISLTSSVTLQQFLSSHNFNLQNTTIPTWTEFLTRTTPFNLNIEILDLPTGQLAEANITRFDSNGRPTSGTLTLDTDANGLGWF